MIGFVEELVEIKCYQDSDTLKDLSEACLKVRQLMSKSVQKRGGTTVVNY